MRFVTTALFLLHISSSSTNNNGKKDKGMTNVKRTSNIKKLLSKLKGKRKKDQQNASTDNKSANNNSYNSKSTPFSTDLNENQKMLREILGDSADIVFSDFVMTLKNGGTVSALLCAIDGLVNEDAKRNSVLKPLIEKPLEQKPDNDLTVIKHKIPTKQNKVVETIEKAVKAVLKAHVLLIIDGFAKGIIISIEGFEIRAIDEPETEKTVRGAREGFIESTGVNTSLLRRRITHPSLRFETLEVGKFSQTNVTLTYIKGITDPDLVERARTRIKEIDVDSVNNNGEIEQMIEDHPFSIFPTIGNTERADKASALLMDGRILIFIDGDPVALFAPNLFLENFINIEDYSSRPYYATFIRLIRYFSFLFSITLPALYVSALNFNKSLIPSDALVPLIQARETVPFPLVMEIVMLILMFEVVREAGIRLPQQIGTAISIVGPLILGDVAVSAGLVGAPTVVIVSLSYMAAFVITPIADVTGIMRLVLLAASSLFGSYGLCIALLGLLTHMVSLTSLGAPYMAPFAPIHFRDWKDALVRLPTKWLKKRPRSIPNTRPTRIQSLPRTGEKE